MSLLKKARTVLLLTALSCLALTLSAQDIDAAAKLRLAQNFEQAGEWGRAVALYEALLEKDPQNYMYFDGLRRGYTQLKEYEKAIRIVQTRLDLQPSDIGLLSILGGLFYQSGDQVKADSLWQLVINTDPKNQNVYRLVASQMIEHRQYEKAIRIYLSARTATGNGELFIEDVALLYAALQQYDLATSEYVKMLRSKPQQLTYVEARMSSFMGREEGRRAAIKVVKEDVQRSQNDAGLHSLLAWLFIESKDFESALVEYRAIDKLNKANGAELFQFAQRAMQERAYRSAAKAFREVIEEYPKQHMTPYARYGYARSIEELSLEADSTFAITGSSAAWQISASSRASSEPVSETRPSYQGALSLYESIITDYPNSDTYVQSLYRIGYIRFHRFFDLDGAIAAFGSVRRNPMNQNLSLEATAGIAEVQTARNNLKQARAEYASLLGVDQHKERVVFRLAELDYFETSFDSALAKVKALTTNLNTDLANDALQLLYFIQENKTNSLAVLGEFAKADLLMRQRKYSEALSRFKEIAKTYPTALLQDDALMKIGELHLLLNQTNDGIGVFKQISNDMPTSILRDRAQMRIGEIYERILKDVSHAIEAYEQVLVKFPTSLYVGEARKRIRLLRGDTI